MALYLLDTSVLLKLYVEEAGTAATLALTGGSQHLVAISAMGVVEFRAVIRARQRAGGISSEHAERMLNHFEAKLGQPWLHQPISEATVVFACLLLDRHSLRAPDALQLASCLSLRLAQPDQEIRFACSDQRLLRAARSEGVPCWDPAAG